MTVESLKELVDQKEQYRLKVIELSKKPIKKVGYHFNCPDGIVSAALIKHVFSKENLIFIPIDYPILKDKEVMKIFVSAKWFAIVDLSPFNIKKIDYFFDHHISNVGQKINAKNYVFDPKAPSAASLIANYFSNKIPDFIIEVSRITEITDTASYGTPAPLDLKLNFEEYNWEEKIWFLEDTCKSTYTIEEHNQLIDFLSSKGLKGLWKEDIINRVKILRQSRRNAFKISEEIEIKDFITIIDKPLNYNIAFIASEVMKRGAIGVAYITVYPKEVKISLRLNRNLEAKNVDYYRVDLLAQTMSGGGHKGASGAEVEKLEQAIKKISEWIEQKGLDTEIIDLRGR